MDEWMYDENGEKNPSFKKKIQKIVVTKNNGKKMRIAPPPTDKGVYVFWEWGGSTLFRQKSEKGVDLVVA